MRLRVLARPMCDGAAARGGERSGFRSLAQAAYTPTPVLGFCCTSGGRAATCWEAIRAARLAHDEWTAWRPAAPMNPTCACRGLDLTPAPKTHRAGRACSPQDPPGPGAHCWGSPLRYYQCSRGYLWTNCGGPGVLLGNGQTSQRDRAADLPDDSASDRGRPPIRLYFCALCS